MTPSTFPRLDVRPLRDAELNAYLEIRVQSFGLDGADAAAWRARVEADPDAARFGAFSDGVMVGGLRVMPGAMSIGGRSVAMGGVAGVVVRPEARGRGVARALLDRSLAWMTERDLVVSALHPASVRVYRSGGWEIAGLAGEARVPIRSLAGIRADRERPVRRLHATDRAARHDCAASYAMAVPGAVIRSPTFWSWLEIGMAEPGVYAYGVDGPEGLAGYVVYRQLPRGEAGGYTITVWDYAARDAEAAGALWRFLGAHGTQAEWITMPHGYDRDLMLLLDEADIEVTQLNPWMFRTVDLPAAVAARGYPTDRAGSVVVKVQDPWSPGSGTWRISIADGRGRAERIDDVDRSPVGQELVRTDVGAFGALFIGGQSAPALARAGRLGGPTAAVDRLAGLLATPAPTLTEGF